MYYKRTAVSSGVFNMMLSSYFKAHSDLFTKDEQSAFKKEIAQFAETQLVERYIEFNKALRDDLWDYGITRVREGGIDISDPTQLDFSTHPRDWNEGKNK